MKKISNIVMAFLMLASSGAVSDSIVKESQIKYAEIYGGLSIYIGAFIYIDERCRTSYITDSMKSDLERLFKKKTNYTYSEFGLIYGLAEETSERVERIAKDILSASGGCSSERLEQIYRIVRRDKIVPLITKLKD